MATGKKRPSCFEGTREQLLTDIKVWIHDSSTEKPIYVLYGIAGIGKTTVAQTVADYAAKQQLLGASFFFSKAVEEQKTGNHFFSTLAFLLAGHDSQLGTCIASAARDAPDLLHKPLDSQMQCLLLGPIQQVQKAKDPQAVKYPVILVIDALDECLPTHATAILQLLAMHIKSMPNYRIFVTTRPEAHIERVLQYKNLLQPFYLHEIEKSIATGDVQLFLRHAFSKEQVAAVLQYGQWEPTEHELKVLSEKCGILFIMATTAVHYILDDSIRPGDQMSRLLKGLDEEEGEEGVMSSLDKMYLEILRSSVPQRYTAEYLQNFKTVVGVIVVLEDLLSLSALARFLDMKESDVQITLRKLHSIIAPTSSNQVPQLYHKSFPDFITNNQRCVDTSFYIVPEEHHAQAAQHCLQKFMANSDVNIDDDKRISDELVYACMHWANHLSKSGSHLATELLGLLDKFAFTHLLHWIEVLSLIGKLEVAYPAMNLAQNALVRYSVSHVNHG
jgi:hypothetical protein